uniref:Uncharacterized protein n=1 Tax=Anopheles epiroticus TaxID=199890 RepID=A0A182PVW5_9DIPT
MIIIIDHKEVKANGRYIKAWIEDVGDHEWNRTYLFHFEALRDIKDIRNHYSYSIRAFDGAVKNALVSRVMDGCDVYNNPPTNRLIKMYYDPVVKYSKIPPCPYKPGDTMMLNITPSVFPIPSFVPETEFVLIVKGFISVGKIRLFETRWYVGSMRLIATINHKEVKANDRYLKAWIEDVGDPEWNRTYLIHYEAVRDIKDVKTQFSYSIRAFSGAVQNKLISRWVDICEVIRNPPTNRIIKMYYDPVVKYSKMPPCPYKPGDTMMVNITSSALPIPSSVPETDFLIEVKGFMKMGKEYLLETRWYGKLERVFID